MTTGIPTGARARTILAVSLLLVLGLTAACSSSASLQFRCTPPINGGLLLTVDVVRATDEQARQVQALGEKWFYDPLRDTLRDRITTVTFPTKDGSGDCVRDVKVAAGSKDKYLVIIADYKFQSPDASKQIVSLPSDRWKGQTIRIVVHDREIAVESK